MHQKLIIFSLIGCFITTQINAQVTSSLDEETLEYLRAGAASPQDELLFPPVVVEEAVKPLPKPAVKPIVKEKKAEILKKQPELMKVEAKTEVVAPIVQKEVIEEKAEIKAEEPKVEVKTEEFKAAGEPVLVISTKPEDSAGSEVENPIVETKEEIKPVETTKQEAVKAEAPSVQDEAEAEKVVEPISPVKAKVEPLIPVGEDENDAVGEVVFLDDSYQLDDEYRDMLLGLVKQFENAVKNKILIVAYNFDDGESSFKKKRLALNRATEIRSHLIAQGYKNFSIKIINTDDVSMKNKAEVSELKN